MQSYKLTLACYILKPIKSYDYQKYDRAMKIFFREYGISMNADYELSSRPNFKDIPDIAVVHFDNENPHYMITGQLRNLTIPKIRIYCLRENEVSERVYIGELTPEKIEDLEDVTEVFYKDTIYVYRALFNQNVSPQPNSFTISLMYLHAKVRGIVL